MLRLEDKQQELKAKLLKMTASLEAARAEHKVTAAAAAAGAVFSDAFIHRPHVHGCVGAMTVMSASYQRFWWVTVFPGNAPYYSTLCGRGTRQCLGGTY